jgi:hypothetical protein
MRSTTLRYAVVIGLASAAIASSTEAQTAPYSRLRLRLDVARNVNSERLHDYWRAGTGGGIAITTPFYLGSIGATALVLPFQTRDLGRPNFKALMLGLDWGVELPLRGPLRARAAGRVGDFVMLIENPDVWLDSESELFVGGELSAAFQLRRDLAVSAAGSFTHVRTRPALDLALMTIGLEYATRTPGWLRAILE